MFYVRMNTFRQYRNAQRFICMCIWPKHVVTSNKCDTTLTHLVECTCVTWRGLELYYGSRSEASNSPFSWVTILISGSLSLESTHRIILSYSDIEARGMPLRYTVKQYVHLIHVRYLEASFFRSIGAENSGRFFLAVRALWYFRLSAVRIRVGSEKRRIVFLYDSWWSRLSICIKETFPFSV